MNEVAREKAAFATWLAKQHLRFDKRLAEAIFLPSGSPENQVRLLEVNTGLFPEPGSNVFPIEVAPASPDLPFHIWVADITPEEWARIQNDPSLLPEGWTLEGSQTIKRVQ